MAYPAGGGKPRLSLVMDATMEELTDEDRMKLKMFSEYREICSYSRNMLHNAEMFCSILNRWIDKEWYKRFYHEQKGWIECGSMKEFLEGRVGFDDVNRLQDLELLKDADFPGAQRIWCYYKEEQEEAGQGLGEHGGDRKSDQGSNTTLKQGRGTDYLMGRLIRDANDDKVSPQERQKLRGLIDDVKEGKQSINKAAIAAGYRKKKTPKEQIISLWAKCSEAEREELLEQFAGQSV